MILALVASTDEFVGHRGFIVFVSIFGISITTILFLLSFINLQAVCMPTRWLSIVRSIVDEILFENILIFFVVL